jgi:hypothetical protein
MDRPYVARNDAGRERLRQLVARLSDDLMRRRIDDAWTVSAVLAHLAFWDRFVLERWALAEREENLVPPVLDDAVQDMVNAAALPQWRELAPHVAAREALEAARAVDEKIERLSAAAVEAIVASGRLALVDRTAHRGPHLDEIERALH